MMIFALLLVALRLFYSAAEVYFECDWPRKTWRGLVLSLLLCVICANAFGQAARVDYSLQTSGPNVPYSGGPLPQALWVSNSQVYICTHPSATLAACQANPVTTYTDATKATTCFSTAQMVQLPGSTCTASSGVTANVGFWYDGGLVDYWVVSAYGTYGPFSIAGSGGSASFLAYVNGVAVITPGSANFVNSSSITVTNPSTNQIQFTAVGGAGCTMQGVAGIFNVSNGNGGCAAVDASYGIVLPNTFQFGVASPRGFFVDADVDNGIQLTSNGATNLTSSTGLELIDGTGSGTYPGSFEIVEDGQGGSSWIDHGGGIDIQSLPVNYPSVADGGGWTVTNNGGWQEESTETGSTSDFGFTIENATNPSTLPAGFPGEYGMNLSDDTADGIYIDEAGTGRISLGANNIYLHSGATPGSGTACLQIDSTGLVTNTGSGCGGTGGTGTVTSVATGTGLTGGPILTTGTISCVQGSASAFGCVEVDNTTITASGGVISAVAGGAPAFSAVIAGTNTHALLMGTGGSLAVSGSGTIAATTAAALASAPTGCTGGQFATGVAANGNAACATPSGTGITLTTTGTGGLATLAGSALNVPHYAGSGANSDITSITGLTTPLSPSQGGTGSAGLTGYVYGNGSSIMTAATTVPGSAITGNIPGNAANLYGTPTLPTGIKAATGTLGENDTNVATNAQVYNATTGVGVPHILCSGTITLSGTVNFASTAAVGSATCTGLTSANVVIATFNGNIFTVGGFIPSTNGVLSVSIVPSTNTITVNAENNTTSIQTIGSSPAAVLNYLVIH